MIQLNPFAISGLLIIIAYVPLIIFVLLKSRTKLTIIFCCHLISVALWGVGCLLIATTTNQSLALNLWKFSCIPVTFIPVFFLHVVFILTNKYSKALLVFSYFQALFYSLAILNDKCFLTTRLVFNSFYYIEGTPLYFSCFIIWMLIILVAHLRLTQFYKKTYPEQKQQIFLLILAFPIGFGGGITNFFPTFQIDVYPGGNFLVAFYSLIFAYAILKHHFCDINVVIQKSIAYSILIAFITAIYSMLVLGVSWLFQGMVGYHSYFLNLLSIFVIAFLFNPLRDQIQKFLDKSFFQGTLETLAHEKQRLQQELFHKEKLAYVGQLASSVVHEIRNPLAAIKTFIEYLPQKYTELDFREKFYKLIPNEICRIERVVGQLLNLAKPRPPNFNPVNISTLIDSTIMLLEENFSLKKIDIKNEYAVNNVVVMGDEEQLRQVFLNLFLNAVQAMEEGGLLSIGIRVSSSVEITIDDTGCGISEDHLKKLFEPFHTTKRDGIGLGLSIAREIIKLHDGVISVESKLGKGTRFLIKLPKTRNNVF